VIKRQRTDQGKGLAYLTETAPPEIGHARSPSELFPVLLVCCQRYRDPLRRCLILRRFHIDAPKFFRSGRLADRMRVTLPHLLAPAGSMLPLGFI